MATITFYEKTGCINNTKQKRMLSMAGHAVEPINLIHFPWTKDILLSFFAGMPVADWFNKNAPSITNGTFDPTIQTEETAIDAMLAEPILIRRPLLVVNGKKLVGFDKEEIDQEIGLLHVELSDFQTLAKENLDDCPQKTNQARCD